MPLKWHLSQKEGQRPQKGKNKKASADFALASFFILLNS
jgi:hypothetical protein